MKEPSLSETEIDILWQCLITGGLGSLAGVAALLRSSNKLDRRTFCTAVLNSGLFSLAMGGLVTWHFGDHNFLLAIVLSVLSGLGGNALIDFALGLIRLAIQKRFDEDSTDK